jgi:NitT/TauT family transport system substrate-binding protein
MHMHFTKMSMHFVVGLVLTAPLVPCQPSVAADAAHTLSLSLDWLPLGQHGPFYLAADKGWFKKADLDVTISTGTGSVTTVQLVNAGQFDVGYASLAAMAMARAKGMPVVGIAGLFRKGDLSLLVPMDSSIKGPADVKGKKLMFTAGSFEGPFIDPFLAKGGITREQLDLINIAFSSRVSTYVSRAVDGVFGSAVGEYVSVSAKLPTRPILFADVGLNIPTFGLVATETMLQKKGDALRKFASIISGAWAYVLAGHEEEAAQAVLRGNPQARLDPAIVRAQIKASVPFFYTPATATEPIGVQSDADWAKAISIMENVKIIDAGSKPSQFITNKFLDLNLIKATAESS